MPSPVPLDSPPNQSESNFNFPDAITLNQSLAALVELAGCFLIEKNLFQNAAIPMMTLVYLANDLIKLLNKEEDKNKKEKKQPEKMNLYKEFAIMSKQLLGKKLTPEEEKYDDEIHELDVTNEIFNGIKYATSFSILKNLYNSVSTTITQGLWEHAPAIIGSTAAITVGPYLLTSAIEKILVKTNLSDTQKNLLKPWLNTVARLALAFTPKVSADEKGVIYQYPSTESHKEFFQQIKIEVPLDTTQRINLLPDKPGTTLPTENLEFKLHRVQLGQNETIEVFVLNNKNQEIKLDFNIDQNQTLSVKCADANLVKNLAKLFSQKTILEIPKPDKTENQSGLQLNENLDIQPPEKKNFALLDLLEKAWSCLPTSFSSSYTITALTFNYAPMLASLAVNYNKFSPEIRSLSFLIGGVSLLPLSIANVFNFSYVPIDLPKGNEGIILSCNQTDPIVSANQDRGFTIAWLDCGQPSVAFYNSDLKEIAHTDFVTKNSVAQQTIVSLVNGNSVLAFVVNVWDYLKWDYIKTVKGMVLNTAAASVTDLSITSDYGIAPALAKLADGNFAVAYESKDKDGEGIFGEIWDKNFVRITSPFQVNNSTQGDQKNPKVIGVPGGGMVFVYESRKADGSTGIFAQEFSRIGTKINSEYRLNFFGAENNLKNPTIAVLGNGELFTVWQSYFQGSSGWDIFGMKHQNGTTLYRSEFAINTENEGDQINPTIAALPNGFIVVWESSQVGMPTKLKGQYFNFHGEKISSEFLIGNSIYALKNPSVTVPFGKNPIVTWEISKSPTSFDIGQLVVPRIASNINQTLNYYQLNQGLIKLHPISIFTPANIITAKLKLSDPAVAGLGVFGSYYGLYYDTSSYDDNLGLWQVTDTVINVNGLLGDLYLVPNKNYSGNFSINFTADDGIKPALTNTIQVNVIPSATPSKPTPSLTPCATLRRRNLPPLSVPCPTTTMPTEQQKPKDTISISASFFIEHWKTIVAIAGSIVGVILSGGVVYLYLRHRPRPKPTPAPRYLHNFIYLNDNNLIIKELPIEKNVLDYLKIFSSSHKEEIKGVQCDRSDFVNFFEEFLESISVIIPSIKIFAINNSQLNNSHIAILTKKINKFSALEEIDFDHNKIGMDGFKELIQHLPKAFEKASLRFNLIDYTDSTTITNQLNDMTTKIIWEHTGKREIYLEGNRFDSNKHNKKLKLFLYFLLDKVDATIDEILKGKFLEIKEYEQKKYKLVLKINSQEKETEITKDQLENIAELGKELDKEEIFSKKPEFNEKFKFLNKYIFNENCYKKIKKEVLSKKGVNKSRTNPKELKELARDLSDHHESAPLKGYLRTHQFFRSSEIGRAHSLFLPNDVQVSVDHWVVYIIAIKKGIFKQHAWMAYEGITTYGQRFFRIAEVTVHFDNKAEELKAFILGSNKPGDIQLNKILSRPEGANLFETINYFTQNCEIAYFISDSKKVKNLHYYILSLNGKTVENYKSSFSNSQRDKYANCVSWPLDRIVEFLNFEIPDEIRGLHEPYEVVAKLASNEEIRKQNIKNSNDITLKKTVNSSHINPKEEINAPNNQIDV